ncbi:haloacid dehalogenase superfamily, subfamily IA, variant 3 with third motif having DD or ED [Paracoccus isoporae]|uniref:Haloacid dehalogenase superfamily, subfamily IA, variant 3 with third motif having DD or ED n=1 Tax=Paracoccus isoporae TaxID=591205 RepID=A0A1G6ZIV9_9RHOB|nr:HAD family phosphatase [Paracoccus isoporae]SDE02684.1 haloacid dehalogenase superfamily, subfamily IA, variant 3 with third motif having DD or ED [Paracoccus isoporae]
MSISAVIWDIDGTLVDSEPLHLRALHHVCAHHGVEISDLPPDHFVGVNVQNVWRALADRFPAELAFERWLAQLNAYYSANAHDLAPIAHAVETVRQLADMGIPQGAASNSNRLIVDTNLRALRLSGILSMSVSLDDVANGKPDPEPYLRAMRLMNLAPQATMAVEDSATGAESARRAGMRVVALGAELPQADICIASLAALPGLITAAPERRGSVG